MLVEQECGAVEPDGRLAGARTALHDQARLEGRADDRVLFGLDRRDDVAHLAGPGPAELGEQRVGHAARTGERVGIVEVLLEHVRELARREHEPAAPREAERVGEGRPVERCRNPRPPVDDDRRAAVVLDVAPADVPAVAPLLVDAAEAQHGGPLLEGDEPPLQLPFHRFGVGLVGGEDVLVGDLGGGPAPHRVETFLGEPEARAFRRHVRVRHLTKDTRRVAGSRADFRLRTSHIAQVVQSTYIARS